MQSCVSKFLSFRTTALRIVVNLVVKLDCLDQVANWSVTDDKQETTEKDKGKDANESHYSEKSLLECNSSLGNTYTVVLVVQNCEVLRKERLAKHDEVTFRFSQKHSFCASTLRFFQFI